jgi:transketolase
MNGAYVPRVSTSEERIRHLRARILLSAYSSQEGHVPSALSIIEPILAVFEEWDVFPGGRDSFVLSKGHGSLALYAVLEDFNLIESGQLERVGRAGSLLGGHPDSTKIPGVIASTGSLGHGLPMGVGLAYSKKNFEAGGRVFVLIGDGECNEGSIWEAGLLASTHGLSNLTVWVDFNHSGDRAIQLEPLAAKWEAFGFEVIEIDGHDYPKVLTSVSTSNSRPTAIIGHTVKGKGVQFMENSPQWHHSNLDADTYMKAISGL